MGGFEGDGFGDAEYGTVAGDEQRPALKDADVAVELDNLGLAFNAPIASTRSPGSARYPSGSTEATIACSGGLRPKTTDPSNGRKIFSPRSIPTPPTCDEIFGDYNLISERNQRTNETGSPPAYCGLASRPSHPRTPLSRPSPSPKIPL